MSTTSRVALLAVLLSLSLGGCECAGREGATSDVVPVPSSPSEQEVVALPMGVVEGVVRLAEGAELARLPENPLQVAGRPAIPEECTPPRDVDRTPVTLAEGGGLVGLSIVASGSDASRWPRATEPVQREFEIRDCRLTPSLVVATRGDRLQVSNDSLYPFFPDLGEGMAQALLRGEPREVTLERGGIHTIQCGVTAPCGRADIITLYHPVHTVTGSEGRFRLEIPAGQDVRLTAWHPMYQEASVSVRVEEGQTRQVELEIRPAALVDPSSAQPSENRGSEELF